MAEVLSFSQANQFQPGRTLMACGFFAVAILTSASAPGEPPRKSPGQVASDALAWYAQYNGDNSRANGAGMSLEQLHRLLTQVGWGWQNVAMDAESIRVEVRKGNPVLIALEESSVFDLDLGRNPYPWNPGRLGNQDYNHIISVTGLDAQGNFLCRDSASIQPPNTLRPGPRRYAAERLHLISATACISPAAVAGYIPAGWHDEKGQLRGSYGRPVTRGFRQHILADKDWPASRVALTDEIGVPAKQGGGTFQVFPDILLRWTPAQGVSRIEAGVLLTSLITKGKADVSFK